MVLQGSLGTTWPDPTRAGATARGGGYEKLTTPRAAAVAGIVFAVLMGSAYVLARLAIPADATKREWLVQRADLVKFGLGLVPFAGIAFLWFIGVIRDRVGAREDRFFATVFLGSGLLFVAMLFTAAAVGGGLIAAAHSSTPPPPDTLITARSESRRRPSRSAPGSSRGGSPSPGMPRDWSCW